MTNKKMTRNQLLRIASAGFPKHVREIINIKNCKMFYFSDVYRLYDRNEEFTFILPNKDHFALHYIPEKKFVQFTVLNKAFNHYAALKEMEKMGLI